MATYNLTEDLMKPVSVASMIPSIKCAGWDFSNLNLRFKKPDDIIRLKEESLQKSFVDYTSS